ncbi:MAG: oligosaccharide flippase family protein [Phycisphaeraceae bacterium]|nr:oligosaccharide flippase family protein [Phycisphaeraceae bacterium]
MSEAKRGLVRVLTNYGRLAATLLIGLVIAPVLLHAVGKQGAGLIAFLTSVVAVSELSQRIIETVMVRELSAAYHSGDRTWFRSVYSSASLACAGAALVAMAVFAVILIFLHKFNINPPELLPAARWFILARMVEIVIVILVAPQLNLYLATERMAAYNLWLILRRGCYLLGALGLLLPAALEPGRGVVLYAYVSSGLVLLSSLLFAGMIFWRDGQMIPRLSLVRRKALTEVVGVGGWNAMVMSAVIVPESIAQLIMNSQFGLVGNLIWGYAFQMSAYIRMLTSGMTTGLDAVTARISSSPDTRPQVQRLVYHATRLHGLMAFPALVGLSILAEPIIRVWVGNRPNFPPEEVGRTVNLMRILAVAWGLRSIADGWMAILYGAGHVRKYAPLILAGGFLNPLIALALVIWLPEGYRYLGPAWAFAVVLSGFFFIGLPCLGAPLLGLERRDLFGPLLRPLIAATVAGGLLWPYARQMNVGSVRSLLVALVLYVMIYALICWVWVLSGNERQRVWTQVNKRIGRQ